MTKLFTDCLDHGSISEMTNIHRMADFAVAHMKFLSYSLVVLRQGHLASKMSRLS